MQAGQRTGNASADFNPGQWLNEDRTKMTPNEPGNISFSKGPRNCVGKSLALCRDDPRVCAAREGGAGGCRQRRRDSPRFHACCARHGLPLEARAARLRGLVL